MAALPDNFKAGSFPKENRSSKLRVPRLTVTRNETRPNNDYYFAVLYKTSNAFSKKKKSNSWPNKVKR